ncbi:hypothetical protein GQX74_000291 [Glossina fuscipes]|nr:hypothetical protein GQX74_000291 [Glossina fuscipes]
MEHIGNGLRIPSILPVDISLKHFAGLAVLLTLISATFAAFSETFTRGLFAISFRWQGRFALVDGLVGTLTVLRFKMVFVHFFPMVVRFGAVDSKLLGFLRASVLLAASTFPLAFGSVDAAFAVIAVLSKMNFSFCNLIVASFNVISSMNIFRLCNSISLTSISRKLLTTASPIGIFCLRASKSTEITNILSGSDRRELHLNKAIRAFQSYRSRFQLLTLNAFS